MGRPPTHNRLDLCLCKLVLPITICAVLATTGCNKLASRHALNHRNLPLTNQDSALTQKLDNQRQPQQPVQPQQPIAANTETLKPRPPKLQEMPEIDFYAEPIVTEAAQVSFEEDIEPQPLATTAVAATTAAATPPTPQAPIATTASTQNAPFDPTAEPPVQIFAQPVAASPASDDLSIRVADSRILTPMLFNAEDRKVNPSFNESLRQRRSKNGSTSIKLSSIEPLIVVDSTPTVPSVPSQIESVSPFPLRPEIDSSSASLRTTPPETEELSSTGGPVIDPTLTRTSAPALPTVLARAPEPAPEIEKEPTFNDSTIEIDENLSREIVTLPPPRKVQPIPAPPIDEPGFVVDDVVEAPPLPSFPVSLPTLDPPPSIEAITEALPEIDFNQVAESDFEPISEPVKRCPNCNHEDCAGCRLPDVTQFASHVPDFEPSRHVEHTDIAADFTGVSELVRKNHGRVDFSPTDLPLPSGISHERPIETKFDTSEDQFRAAAYDFSNAEPSPSVEFAVPAVGVEALKKINAVTWRSRLAQTVDLVKQQLGANHIDSDTRTSLEVNLRLLDVLSRQMNDLAEAQQQFSPSENQYWQDQLEAITSMLKVSDSPNARSNELLRHHTAHETLSHLRNAVAHLESLANLRVTEGEFCTEVSGYGQFETFSSNLFPAGQKVLVYCEIENFTSVAYGTSSQNEPTYLTRLRGSYAIYDSTGKAVQQAEFPTLEDRARKRRRDFYMHLPITIGELAAGNYELHLLIEDLEGNKTASLTPPLAFTVQPSQPADRQARR